MRRQLVALFEPYAPDLDVCEAGNAQTALEALRAFAPHALLLDLMMPYGALATPLDRETDPGQVQTGLQLLKWIRKQEAELGGHPDWPAPLWVTILTARSDVFIVSEARHLLGAHGNIHLKPQRSFRIEHEIVCRLGIESQVPPVFLATSDEFAATGGPGRREP